MGDAILVVYVDALLTLTAMLIIMESFVEDLNSSNKIKDLGKTSYYTGCLFIRNRERRELNLNQHLYLRTIIGKFGIDKIAMVPTTATGSPLLMENGPNTPKEKEKMSRRLRPLRHLKCCRRVAKIYENPDQKHKGAVLKVLQNLRRNQDLGYVS